MKKTINRILALSLAILTLFAGIVLPAEKALGDGEKYNNISSVTTDSTVNSSGLLTASMRVRGIKGKTTRIDIELYIEKRVLGLFWTRVNLNTPNNIWSDTTSNYLYNNSFTFQLNSSGTYRVTTTFTIYGTGGTEDVIVKTNTITH